MNKLRIPKRLTDTLTLSSSLYGAVLSSLAELEPWIADNKLPFFPEYTDHGPDHINQVFVTAEALIRDEAWEVLTPEDAAVLVLAILLHDCAMHLRIDGFIALLALYFLAHVSLLVGVEKSTTGQIVTLFIINNSHVF